MFPLVTPVTTKPNPLPTPQRPITPVTEEVFALCAANAHEADGGDGAALFLLGSMAEHSCRWGMPSVPSHGWGGWEEELGLTSIFGRFAGGK